jgi:hypothetical protein
MGYSFLIMRQLHRLKPAAKGTKAQRDKVTKGKGKRTKEKGEDTRPLSFHLFPSFALCLYSGMEAKRKWSRPITRSWKRKRKSLN